MTEPTKPTIPYRQIRAQYDADTITVYQAYNTSIAEAAVREQKLNASPLFRVRMTWIKPSWAWMMYRAGYSYKDAGQARILAIKMSHSGFFELLRRAELTHGPPTAASGIKGPKVKVQWDPERNAKLGKLLYRSIQIGIPGGLGKQWIDEWIVGIEDVTEMAQSLKKAIDENENCSLEDLSAKGLFPEEKPFEVPEDIREILQMDYDGSDSN
jgi:Domain of unknown function (DUF4291)